MWVCPDCGWKHFGRHPEYCKRCSIGSRVEQTIESNLPTVAKCYKAIVKAVTGKKCGCKKRKNKLNQAHLAVKRWLHKKD